MVCSVKNKYYNKIEKVVESYEMHKPYHPLSIEWAADYLGWCAKFKKITLQESRVLADRITNIFEDIRNGYCD